MDLRTVLVKLGKGALKEIPVVGDLLVGGVNELLSEDKKLTPESTGEQAIAAINTLPPDVQERVYSRQIDLKIEEVRADVEMFKAMMAGDDKVASTRPKVAIFFCYLICYGVGGYFTSFFIAIWFSNQAVVTALTGAWEIVLALLSAPTTYLLHYIGKRTAEKTTKIAAATGSPVGGVVSQLIGMLRR